jgi:acyl-CoA synthetase (AMP-forming)/AMP-acid ligase II
MTCNNAFGVLGKLFSRSIKIAHMLKTKTTTVIGANGHKEKIPICKPGDCVALCYPNTDPLSYLTAFYGCLLAGIVPISVEVPTVKRDAGLQQFGFLLSSCGVRVALTSESCLKELPKFGSSTSSSSSASHVSNAHHTYPTATTGSGGSNDLLSSVGASTSASSHSTTHQAHNPNDVIDFKGWPRLQWLTTENLNRPPKDFSLTPPTTPKETAYIEHSSDVEGTVSQMCIRCKNVFILI